MTEDKFVNNVISLFESRSRKGMQHYGQSMSDNPKDALQWAEDAQEELMDAILYIEALKDRLVELKAFMEQSNG